MGGHTVNRAVGYGVHSYINLKILGGHVPVCPPYEYGPDAVHVHRMSFYLLIENKTKDLKLHSIHAR